MALAPAALLLAACSGSDSFSVKMADVPEDFAGQTLYLISPETGDTLGSGTVKDSEILIKGKIEKPVIAMIVAEGNPMAQLIVEPGKITIDADGIARGTKANDAFAAFTDQTNSFIERLNSAGEGEADSLIRNEYVPEVVKFVSQNPANPYNMAVFAEAAPYMDAPQLQSCIDADTIIGNNPQVKHLLELATTRQDTGVGAQYVDLQIAQEDGTLVKLSDYIKPGRYTLVDFWASWCGPCRREIPGLIELYKQYHAKGLDVVGVAVWEQKDDDTRQAIKELGINYPVILHGDQTATNAYGIYGIPCILLIDPQGKIIGRDLFGEQLQQAVKEAMSK